MSNHCRWNRDHACFAKLVALALLMIGGLHLWANELQTTTNAKMEQAQQAVQAGQFSEAAAIYRELIKSAPGNNSLLLNLGLAEYLGGNSQRAALHFEAALKTNPNLFPAQMFLGASFLNLGEAAKAVLPLQKAVTLQPKNPMARQFLGDAYLTLEKFDAARKQFSYLSVLEPNNPLAWVGLGQGNDALAQKMYATLQRVAPDSPWTKFLRAEELMSQQKYPDALSLYRQSLYTKPELHEARTAIAEIYRLTDHSDWANLELERAKGVGARDCAKGSMACDFERSDYENILKQAEANKKQDVETLFWMARAYDRLANTAFSRLDQLPESADRHQVMAQIYTNQDRYVDAAKEWRAALQIAPDHTPYEKGLAVALYESREYEAAEKLIRKILQSEPETAQWDFMLGSSLLNQHKVDDAIPYLTEAVKKSPQLPQIQQALATAYLERGDAREAIPYLKASLSLDTDGSLRYQLGQAYRRAGLLQEAEEMLRQYQQMQKKVSAVQPKELEITPP